MSDQRDKSFADLATVAVALTRHLELAGHQHEDVVELTPTEVLVTRYLEFHPGSSATEVAHNLKLQASNLSTALKALEGKAMITRERSPEDGRLMLLNLTPKASRSISQIRAAWSQELSDTDLSDSDLAITLRSMQALLAKYETF